MFQRTGFSSRITATVMSTFSEPNWACPQELSQSCRQQVQDHPCSSGIKGSEILYWSQDIQGGWVALSACVREFVGRFSLDRRRAPRVSRGTHARNNSLTVRQADNSISWALMS